MGGTLAAGLVGDGTFTVVSGTTTMQPSVDSTGGDGRTGGTTVIQGGTLKMGLDGLGSVPMEIDAAGTLDLAGFGQNVGTITGSGTITSSANLGGPAILVFNDGAATDFAGTIKDGASSIALSLDRASVSLAATTRSRAA